MMKQDTICAIATPSGQGALAIIRVSGNNAIQIVNKIFYSGNKAKNIVNQQPNTIHYGILKDEKGDIDEVLISIFKSPHSYTGDDTVEISCHGSPYIQQRIMNLLIRNGARPAEPGEFTLNAFLNGKMDLSQAEAVDDLIASRSESSHHIALQQMRGGFSEELKSLRGQLLQFVSLIELELDFSEEDVEFADRKRLMELITRISEVIEGLLHSFELGNVLKNGIPVAIVGNPNVGKSTLLNKILKEEKAIVSEIPGTTRDAIEDVVNIEGYTFRFIDTAGIRQTRDIIENLGIQRTYDKIRGASIILLMIDIQEPLNEIYKQIENIDTKEHQTLIVILNKMDKLTGNQINDKKRSLQGLKNIICLSALSEKDIHIITERLTAIIRGIQNDNDIIISNTRHYNALYKAKNAMMRVTEGLESSISTVLLAADIREALHYIGEITGEITTDEILGNIFKNFCIGK